MNKIRPTVVMYTHSSYKDVWPLFFGQARHYLGDYKLVVFCDRMDDDIPTEHKVIIYDESKPYRTRVSSCLDKMTDEYIIFHHEDMFLYDVPSHELIGLYFEHLKNFQFDAVRLIKCGETRDFPAQLPGLYQLPMDSDHIFAIQPTIWSVQTLKRILLKTPGETIWEFERNAQQTCRDMNVMCFYTHHGETKRGRTHWNSKVYPYVATAVVKGKWNFREYKNELKKHIRCCKNFKGAIAWLPHPY